MAFKRVFVAVAAAALGAACASAPAPASPQAPSPPSVFAGKSVLDAAIDAAGGQAALSQVKELEWTGAATIRSGGKTSVVEVETVIRPLANWGRTSTWVKADGPKTARTIQAEQGKAWLVNRVTWTPMPEAQATHENQQFALYALMLLTPLKNAQASVSEQPAGADGGRTIKASLANGIGGDLRFDATGKLVGASMAVRDPAGGADLKQTATFSGEIVSNGVKWPKKIVIEQNGQPYLDLELATFDATPDLKPRPLPHTLDDGQKPPEARPADAG